MAETRRCIVIGGGVFGASTAWRLARDGWQVRLADPGPLPHPRASSTDISKAVRMDYGADALYADLGAAAIDVWRRWNADWEQPLYHQDGFLMMARESLQPGDFEFDGFTLLSQRGVPVERIDRDTLKRRFPAWNAERYLDGYFNPTGGWAQSGRVVAWMLAEAQRAGAVLSEGRRFQQCVEQSGRIVGVRFDDEEVWEADWVVLAAGAWTAYRFPELRDRIRSVGQQVLHFKPERPELFRADRFPVWGADISKTGWYGFPLTEDGVVKVGHHGRGMEIDPDDERDVSAEHEARCRQFLAESFPALADAPIVGRRVCLYADSFDGDFVIDRVRDRPGLIVATGGSGHGFKFAPLIGDWVRARIEGESRPELNRFRWRPRGETAIEHARCPTE